MEFESLLPFLQVASTSPCPEPDPHYPISGIHLNIIHPCPGLPSGVFPSGFPTINLYPFLFSPLSCYVPEMHAGFIYYSYNSDLVGLDAVTTSVWLASFDIIFKAIVEPWLVLPQFIIPRHLWMI
jgi:hypothetical protein